MTDSHISRSRWIAVIIVVALVAIDQFVKFVVTGPLSLQNRETALYLLPFFDLRYVENPGISLGLFAASSDIGRWALVAVTALVSAGIAWWITQEKERGDIIALAIILGGALGNIIDRARLGYVIDYADFHIGEIRPFMIFNVADAAITIGVLLLIGRALLQGSAKSKTIATD